MERRSFLKTSAAALIYAAGQGEIARAMPPAAVSFDERSVMIKGERALLSCGEMHYPRSTRAMWPKLLQRSRELGLNTIATYVFWNFHETSRGVFDFAGERDLGHFLDLCQQHGLSVFLRVGPYICAEWNYGGYPPYLRDEPGITIRTMNQPYMARVEAYYRRLAEVVRPRLASNGGPVVLVQVENEYGNVSKRYGDAGQEYLRWIVELAKRVGLAGVPTTTCEGGAQGAIETSNGFMIPAERIAAVRKSHPGTPLLWTELYPAWYRVWGGRNAPARDPKSMASSILDFVSRGGSGWNYYPWHGGTNFGRNSMYLQTTSYDFHAPLDEYGSVTESGAYLGRFHATMQEQKTILLEGERTESVAGKVRTTAWQHAQGELRLVQEGYEEHPAGGPFRAAPMQVRLLNGKGEPVFDVDAVGEAVTRSFVVSDWKTLPGSDALQWQRWQEPLPVKRHDAGVVAVEPVEQLSLTKDATDYCWYSTTLDVAEAGPQEIVIPFGGDFFYVYVDGVLAASTKLPLHEDRGPITPDDPQHPRIVASSAEVGHDKGFQQNFTLAALAAGSHRLDLLAVALGMVKGDWQIASSMNFERKGIWEGVLLNGKPLRNWTMRPGLVGEKHRLPAGAAGTAAAVPGVEWSDAGDAQTLCWHRTKIHVPVEMLAGASSAVFRLDAAGLGKGLIWVNGHGVGRHWLIAAAAPADDKSQRYYHVPADWLRGVNTVVILEEQAVSPDKVELQVRA